MLFFREAHLQAQIPQTPFVMCLGDRIMLPELAQQLFLIQKELLLLLRHSNASRQFSVIPENFWGSLRMPATICNFLSDNNTISQFSATPITCCPIVLEQTAPAYCSIRLTLLFEHLYLNILATRYSDTIYRLSLR